MDFNSINKISGNEKKSSTEYDQMTYELQNKIKKEDEAQNTIKQQDIKTSTQNNKEGSASFALKGNSEAENAALEEEIYSGKALQDKIKAAIDQANEKLKPVKKEFSYAIHEKTHRVMVSIKNSETGEVIKEIPSEKDLDMLAKIREMAGIVVDQKR